MNVLINGESREIPEGLNVRQLLEHLELPVELMLVEHNQEALLKRRWDQTPVAEGDRVELVRVVAGG
jgi:sulfur carrier protein